MSLCRLSGIKELYARASKNKFVCERSVTLGFRQLYFLL